MSPYVLDASVVIKWFVPEELSAEARRWRKAKGSLHVPDFFVVEMTNILWKKVLRSELTRDDADAIVTTLLELPLTAHSAVRLLPAAFDLACQLNRTVYDCLYLALAIQIGGRFVTADRRLVNSLAATSFADKIRGLEETP